MILLWYLCGIAGGYLIGNLNTAALLARHRGFDIRSQGSHNAGASNALVTMGKGAAICSGLVDILKCFVPVFLLQHVFTLPEGCAQLPVVTGIAVILGHMYPFWLQFKGGKGFASLLGLALGLDWRFFVAGVLIVAAYLLTVRYIVFATITCSVLLPIAWYLKSGDLIGTLLLAALAVLIISKHIVNLRRIKDGTEIKFGEKKKPEQPPADDA
jgi:glycerol-3-phosphate acyltransferase PlsY